MNMFQRLFGKKAEADSPLVSFTFDYNGGNGALGAGDNKTAVERYTAAIRTWDDASKHEDDPIPKQMVAMCLTNLGTAYTRLDMADDALRVLERSLAIAPSFLMAQYNRAWLLERVQRNSEAIQAWESYLASARHDPREHASIPEAERHMSRLKTTAILQKHGVPITKA